MFVESSNKSITDRNTELLITSKTIDCLNQDLEILVVKTPATLARSVDARSRCIARVNGEACIMCRALFQ